MPFTINAQDSSIDTDLVSVLAAIPRAVTQINLSANSLSPLSASQLRAVFASIPSSVHSLDLGLDLGPAPLGVGSNPNSLFSGPAAAAAPADALESICSRSPSAAPAA